MKTEILLPDTLYERADQTASYMGISLSQLFSIVLEDFVSKHNDKMIIEKINEAYEKIDQTEFEPYLNAGLEPLRNLTKNDTW
jgi:hypothetical protein